MMTDVTTEPVRRRGRPKGPLTPEHRAAIIEGREQTRVVREYLEALKTVRPKPGRPVSRDRVTARLAAIDAELADADPLTKLKLVQERFDLYATLAAIGAQVTITDVETAFVAVAAVYSARNGISYKAWRHVGVDPAVLKRAGIT